MAGPEGVSMTNEDQGSVTLWIGGLKAGDSDAAQELWQRYFQALVGLARTRLRAAHRGAEDEEDAALSAFDSFCTGVANGRFPRLDDRDDLWRVLVTLTRRKAFDQIERQQRQKRGGGRVIDEADLGATDPDAIGLDQFAGTEPTPEFAAMIADECQRRLDGLGDATLRRIALLKMEGLTNDEIAAQLDCGLRSVVRKLDLIRRRWLAEVAS
jgi:DNA-directed RNA polymerase specialized sigma24 family protein